MGWNEKSKWNKHLAIYGGDFHRWPFVVSEAQRREIMALPEYAKARELDAVLDRTVWPEIAPEALRGAVMARIGRLAEVGAEARAETKVETAGAGAPCPPLASRLSVVGWNAFMVSCFVLFLCVGLSSGAHFGNTLKDRVDYSYLTLGPAYAYGSFMNGDTHDRR